MLRLVWVRASQLMDALCAPKALTFVRDAISHFSTNPHVQHFGLNSVAVVVRACESHPEPPQSLVAIAIQVACNVVASAEARRLVDGAHAEEEDDSRGEQLRSHEERPAAMSRHEPAAYITVDGVRQSSTEWAKAVLTKLLA